MVYFYLEGLVIFAGHSGTVITSNYLQHFKVKAAFGNQMFWISKFHFMEFMGRLIQVLFHFRMAVLGGGYLCHIVISICFKEDTEERLKFIFP